VRTNNHRKLEEATAFALPYDRYESRRGGFVAAFDALPMARHRAIDIVPG
jgi:hypothetical protein